MCTYAIRENILRLDESASESLRKLFRFHETLWKRIASSDAGYCGTRTVDVDVWQRTESQDFGRGVDEFLAIREKDWGTRLHFLSKCLSTPTSIITLRLSMMSYGISSDFTMLSITDRSDDEEFSICFVQPQAALRLILQSLSFFFPDKVAVFSYSVTRLIFSSQFNIILIHFSCNSLSTWP